MLLCCYIVFLVKSVPKLLLMPSPINKMLLYSFEEDIKLNQGALAIIFFSDFCTQGIWSSKA